MGKFEEETKCKSSMSKIFQTVCGPEYASHHWVIWYVVQLQAVYLCTRVFSFLFFRGKFIRISSVFFLPPLDKYKKWKHWEVDIFKRRISFRNLVVVLLFCLSIPHFFWMNKYLVIRYVNVLMETKDKRKHNHIRHCK